MASPIVFEALRQLAPRDATGVGKIRIGGPGDGGYVLLDRLHPSQVVMSFGIGPSVAFDLEMAERGHLIHLFDHTIDTLPGEHPGFIWHREGIAGAADPAAALFTLADHLRKLPDDARDPILKIDVEGAEWDALAASPSAVLARFAQIAIEMHDLLNLEDPAFNRRVQNALRALAADFVPVHVHGNNFGGLGFTGGFPMVETLEITYARRDLFPTAPSNTFYPTPHDSPNFDERADYPLWFFPFVPGSETMPSPTTLTNRNDWLAPLLRVSPQESCQTPGS